MPTPNTPLLREAAPSEAAHSVHEVEPVRVVSIRDLAQLAKLRGLRRTDTTGLFVARDPVDHPWLGRRETWYDYLNENPAYWRHLLRFSLPARWLCVAAGTWIAGYLMKNDKLVSAQVAALGTPVSAFSLLTSLLLTFRHSIAYQRFWDAKNFTTNILACMRNVAVAFQNAPLEHRKEVAAYLSAIVDALCRTLQLERPTDLEPFERSPPGPWRQSALAALPPAALHRAARTPSSQVATLAGDLCIGAPMQALDGCIRGTIIVELQTLAHQAATVSMLNTTPVPPIYTILLHLMIHLFVAALGLLVALSLTSFSSPAAWAVAASTISLIYTIFLCFYIAARELAQPFQGNLQVPLRMYEAGLIHDIYSILQPITAADVAAAEELARPRGQERAQGAVGSAV